MKSLLFYLHNKVRWDKSVVLLSVILFAMLAGYNITTPGFYYDELLFVNAALGGKINMFIHARFGDLPLMLMPYIGALKAWLYYPIFEIFGVSAYSIRFPVIVIGCFTLWINYRFMNLAFSKAAAIIFIILAAVDPSTLFHTRLDWGPTALMMLFRGLLLLTVFAWIKTRYSWLLFIAALISIVGIFDKLNFIWPVIAIIITTFLVYPERIIEFVKNNMRTSVSVMMLALLMAVVFLSYSNSSLDFKGQFIVSDWWQRFQYVINMLLLTVSGSGVYNVVIGEDDQITRLAGYQLFVLGVTAVSVLPLILIRRNFAIFRPILFITIFMIFLMLQILVTRQATGPHHMAILAPLWLMPMAALLGCAFSANYSSGGMAIKGLSIVAIMTIVFSSSWINVTYLKAFNGTVKPSWDAGSNELVAVLEKVLDKDSSRPIICVDWGLGTILYAHLYDKANVQDNWPTFKDGLSKSGAEYYEREFIPHNPIFVVPAEGMEAFPETRSNFFNSAADRHWRLNRYSEIKRKNDVVLYELYTVTTDTLVLPAISSEQ